MCSKRGVPGIVGLGEVGLSPANAATAREQRPGRRSELEFVDPGFVGPAAALANPRSTISPKTSPEQLPQVTAVTSISGVRLPELRTALSNGESAQSPTAGGSGKTLAFDTPATLRPEKPAVPSRRPTPPSGPRVRRADGPSRHDK